MKAQKKKAQQPVYVSYQGKKMDKTAVCYKTIAECLEDEKSIPQYARIFKVIPLLFREKEFKIPLSDIHEAKFTKVADLNMSVLDNEFNSLENAEFFHEFEFLFPDYQFGTDGIYRTQWELPSGLILTEKSFHELEKLINT